MSKAILVAGLGFGDEGKGTTVEFLAAKHQAHTVVRFNGGAQAAHNIVLEDGRHHTFSQFGAATFRGVHTYLSKFMLVDPLALAVEALHLRRKGIIDPWKLLTVDEQAPIITPWHRAVNRLKELGRKNGQHGSCGVGVVDDVNRSTFGVTLTVTCQGDDITRSGDRFRITIEKY